MSVWILETKYYNEYRAEASGKIIGNIGDKIRMEVKFTLFKKIQANAKDYVSFASDTFPTDDYITTPVNSFQSKNTFFEHIVGDVIDFGAEFPTMFTIIEKISNQTIRVTPSPTANGINYNSTTSKGKTTNPFNVLRCFFSDGSTPGFDILTSNSEQVLYLNNIDSIPGGDFITSLNFIQLGNQSGKEGSATLQRIATGTFEFSNGQYFILKHTFKIQPYMLPQHYDDALLNIAPSYLRDNNSLRHIYSMIANYNPSDSISSVGGQANATTESQGGNVGWYGENFNNLPTNYSLSGLTFKKPSTEAIDHIQLATDETAVEFFINNATDTPFSNNNTKFCLNFIKAPGSASEYYDNNKTIDANFLFDRAFQTLGSAAINGEQYGTSRQVLKDVVGTFISSSQIKITAKIALASQIVTDFASLALKRYVLFVSTQNHTLATLASDRVALKIDQSNFFVETTAPGLVNASTRFLRSPHDNIDTQGVDTLDTFPEDEIVAATELYIDKSVLAGGDTMSIVKADMKVKAKNTSTLEEFDLTKYTFNFAGTPVISGNQYVDFLFDRGYHIPAAEPRRKVKILRRTDRDSGDKFYYDFYFPFIFKWEYWQILAGVHGDFFDLGEPNNGFNNFWQRYSTIGDWKIFYDFVLTVEKNGIANEYHHEVEMTANDYDTNADFNPNTIKSYDDTTELTNGLLKFIYGFKDVRIEARFTYVPTGPTLANYRAVFGIEVFEQGGEFGRRRLSSAYATDGDTWFKDIDGDGKVKMSLDDDDIVCEALIDHNKIPLTNQRYKITCRLYDIITGTLSSKITEDGTIKITEGGDIKVIE